MFAVSTDFLTKLFGFRQRFHVVAANELASSKTVTILVCWVDVILAKIGEAATAIASGWSADPSPCSDMFDSLARQREGDALRAAAQLPHAWEKVPMLLLSESASPAAVRLALCLAFAAYIVRPQLIGMDSTSIDM
ncbi:hypothetical protein EWM64_g248 [Hericium alpestre]|uniref:Uncharacterized protein n=1 Tax=Hericium alpestre TaxID=135208 RepID=A0A4Z0A9N9_9AGAM|nr:hypothetical protein EWM64_g248 [Hericium alpestre]